MAKGVAEIEQSALAFLERVALDYGRLVAAAGGDGMGDGCVVEREQCVCIRFQPSNEARVEDGAVLHHLR